MPELPARPSAEHLRKEAKRYAREHGIVLHDAQYRLARTYGFRSWPALIASVTAVHAADSAPSLAAAVRAGDLERVRALLATGANPRVAADGVPPLHLAAAHGSLALVETLILAGALVSQADGAGRTALDAARAGSSSDRAAIVALLDRPHIADDAARAAVAALQAGDTVELARLIDAEPRLLRERFAGPEIYRRLERDQYFLEPKLFWFVANNPMLVDPMPANIVAVAETMIARGVERADLDYALELTMTGAAARAAGVRRPLMAALLAAGAEPSQAAVVATAAHRELDALRALLALGRPLTAVVAAALGRNDELRDLLATASSGDVQTAFGLAVINDRLEAARLTLDAGADVNAPAPVHAHGTALHHAALCDDAALIALLIARGARADARDTLWDGTPLDWARHERRPAAIAALGSG